MRIIRLVETKIRGNILFRGVETIDRLVFNEKELGIIRILGGLSYFVKFSRFIVDPVNRS